MTGLLSGKTAVITGAGSGIGRETARQLARLKMKLVLADVHEGDLEARLSLQSRPFANNAEAASSCCRLRASGASRTR